MPDLVHETDYRVFGRSTWSGAEVVGREELERVCEMSRYNLVTKAERGSEERDEAGLERGLGGLQDGVRPFALGHAGVVGIVQIALAGETGGRSCEDCASTTCSSTTGSRMG
ncbi:hypothetical protein JCM10049v2_001495 [Rhodotorula toruloides]